MFFNKEKSNVPVNKFRSVNFLLVLAFLFFTVNTYADTAILDNIAGSYKTASMGWATTLLGYANTLFMLLATLELAWSFAVWAMDKNEFQTFTSAIVKKIMWIGLFYALLLNGPVWIPIIVDSFVKAGADASGTVGGLSPSEIFTTGLDNAATMLEGIKKMSLWDDSATIIIAGLSAIVIVLAFAVIAGQLMIALIESYISISAGLLFLGFGGSRWTTDFVQKFIGYAVATGVKLFMLYLVVGVGNAQAIQWKAMLATIGTPGVPVFNIILTVLGGSVILAYIAFQIPAMAASMLSGSPTLTGGGAASTAAIGTAGIVGAAALGAATTVSAAKSIGGMGSAVGSAFKEAGAQGSSGLGRAVGTLSNLGSAGARDTASRMGQGFAQTKGGRMADISQARTAELSAAQGGGQFAPAAVASANEGVGPGGNRAPGSQNTPPPPSRAPAAAGSTPAAAGSAPASTTASPAAGTAPPAAGTPKTAAAAAAPTSSTALPAAPVPSTAPPAAGTPKTAAAAAAPMSSTALPVAPVSSTAPPAIDKASSRIPASAPSMPSGISEKENDMQSQPGLEDGLRSLSQIRPPQLPHDGAPSATIQIRFDNPQD